MTLLDCCCLPSAHVAAAAAPEVPAWSGVGLASLARALLLCCCWWPALACLCCCNSCAPARCGAGVSKTSSCCCAARCCCCKRVLDSGCWNMLGTAAPLLPCELLAAAPLERKQSNTHRACRRIEGCIACGDCAGRRAWAAAWLVVSAKLCQRPSTKAMRMSLVPHASPSQSDCAHQVSATVARHEHRPSTDRKWRTLTMSWGWAHAADQASHRHHRLPLGRRRRPLSRRAYCCGRRCTLSAQLRTRLACDAWVPFLRARQRRLLPFAGRRHPGCAASRGPSGPPRQGWPAPHAGPQPSSCGCLPSPVAAWKAPGCCADQEQQQQRERQLQEQPAAASQQQPQHKHDRAVRMRVDCHRQRWHRWVYVLWNGARRRRDLSPNVLCSTGSHVLIQTFNLHRKKTIIAKPYLLLLACSPAVLLLCICPSTRRRLLLPGLLWPWGPRGGSSCVARNKMTP